MMRMNKKALNLSVDENLVNKARSHQINLSSFFEVKLREYLALIKGNNGEWVHRDLNPGPPPCEDSNLSRLSI